MDKETNEFDLMIAIIKQYSAPITGRAADDIVLSYNKLVKAIQETK